MADKKISQLTELTSPVAEDLLPVVDDPNGTPINKFLRLKNLFGNAGNTVITGTLTVSGGNTTIGGSNTYVTSNVVTTGVNTFSNTHIADSKFTIQTSKTPSTNNATTELGSPTTDFPHDGSLFWDENYLYIAVSNTVIKRVALSTFT
jgi:hypothetical protein